MDDQYSSFTALVYVFNLIIGTGALTLPVAFAQSGWVYGIIVLCLFAVISYMTATFVMEAMSLANAILQWNKFQQMKRVSRYLHLANQAESGDESLEDSADDSLQASADDALLCPEEVSRNFPRTMELPQGVYSIDTKIEMGEMATLLFSRLGRILFYMCFAVYLFGDLTIYATAVGKSLVDACCTPLNTMWPTQQNSTIELCWQEMTFRRSEVYHLFLTVFLLVLGPFAFFNVQKTKHIQIFTTISRWLAFSVMIGLAVRRLALPLPHGQPKPIVPSSLHTVLGSCVYSFMCHHSLPALLSPATNKRRLASFLALDYLLVLSLYLTLALTAVFAFPTLEDLYTLNFAPKRGDPAVFETLSYFLTLFPVFTLTANFPVVAITLRSNLQALLPVEAHWFWGRLLIPLAVVTVPVAVAMLTENIEILVSVTGSYAGVGIQYLIPAGLVLAARRTAPAALATVRNDFASPFASNAWPVLVIVWAVLSIVFVSANIIDMFVT